MKLTIIEGGRKLLEDKVIQDMMTGNVHQEDLDKLRPRGRLHVVSEGNLDINPYPQKFLTEERR